MHTIPATLDEAVSRLVKGYSLRDSIERNSVSLEINDHAYCLRREWHYTGGDPAGSIRLAVSSLIGVKPFESFIQRSLQGSHTISDDLPSLNTWQSQYYDSGFPYENEVPKEQAFQRTRYEGVLKTTLDWNRPEGSSPIAIVPSLDAPWPTLGFIEDRDFVQARGRLTLPSLQTALRQGWEDDEPHHHYRHFVDVQRETASFEYRYQFEDGSVCEEHRESDSTTIERSAYEAMLLGVLEGGRCDRLCKASVRNTTEIVRSIYGAEDPKTKVENGNVAVMITLTDNGPRWATQPCRASEVLR